MTDQHRATPEQWALIEKAGSSRWADADSSCFLELRARVEALEELHKAVVDLNERFNLDPLVARVEALEAAAISAPENPATSSDRPAPADSLVESIEARAGGDARTALRVVAAWLRSVGNNGSADYLEREASR